MKALFTHVREEAEAGRLAYQRCADCGAAQAFARPFCARCGGAVSWETSAGAGRIAAMTVIHRAPTQEYRALAPYGIALVDLDEGCRIMAHAETDLAVGDRVAARFREAAGRNLPCFGRAS